MAYRALVSLVVVTVLSVSVVLAETVTISMKDRVFIPEKITVKVGDTVRWVNDDTELHQVISGRSPYDPDLGSPMMSGVIMWNASYAFTFTMPGSYRYLCFIHSSPNNPSGANGMVGEIVVQEYQP